MTNTNPEPAFLTSSYSRPTRKWSANYIHATLEPADWDDLDADEPACSATIGSAW